MRLIDADALPVKFWYGRFFGVAEIDIVNAPTVDAVPLEDYKSMESTVNKLTQALADAVKHGHWISLPNHHTKRRWCSECGGIAFETYDDYGLAEVDETDFCPHCGAKMDEVEHE